MLPNWSGGSMEFNLLLIIAQMDSSLRCICAWESCRIAVTSASTRWSLERISSLKAACLALIKACCALNEACCAFRASCIALCSSRALKRSVRSDSIGLKSSS